MPRFKVTTKSSNQIWTSPDGQRTIYEAVMDYNGQEVKAKTYSRAISSEGFIGEVESYEKQGSKGTETFVKQAPREGSSYGGGSQSRDDSHIKAQWAIGQAIILHNTMQTGTNIEMDFIETKARELFAMVDRVKDSNQVETISQQPETFELGDTITTDDIPDIFK